MAAIPIAGHVDQDRLLSAKVPESVPPGPVTILVVSATAQDETEDAWMSAVSREWNEQLSDVRQDIYSLEDGDPVDAT